MAGRQFKSLKRRVEIAVPNKKIVIFTEGEKTEKDYFDALKAACRALVDVTVVEGAGVPLTIAKLAAEAAQAARRSAKTRGASYAERDEYWAVFDRDEHPHINDALARCADNHVDVAFSNPCFELWLILHFEDFDKPSHRHDVQKHLETVCDGYDKDRGKTADCAKLLGSLEAAEIKAEAMLKRRYEEGEPLRPPYTSVYRLTRAIRGAKQQELAQLRELKMRV